MDQSVCVCVCVVVYVCVCVCVCDNDTIRLTNISDRFIRFLIKGIRSAILSVFLCIIVCTHAHTFNYTHTHTHTHMYIYIYIYMSCMYILQRSAEKRANETSIDQ